MMNKRFTFLIALFFSLSFSMINEVHAQVVTAIATNSNCPEQGKITASTSGFAAPITGYQLKQGATVVRPIGGTGYQTSNEFLNLPAGAFTVVASDGITEQESTPINVVINYTPITASVAPATVTCASATGSLTVTTTGGSGNLAYAITSVSEVVAPAIASFQASPTFTNLAVGSHKFWVRDNGCTTATIINATGAVNNSPAPDVAAFGLSVLPSLTFASPNNHLSGYRVSIGRFTRGASAMSAAEAASYTVEVLDGGTSIAGPVPVAAVGSTNVAVASGLVGHTLTVVLKNTCTGNTKTFDVSQLGPGMHLLASCPSAQAMYRMLSYSLVALPATITYVNQDGSGTGNQTIIRTVANDDYIYVNFPSGAKFDWKVVDAAGVIWEGEHDFTNSLIGAPSQWTSYVNNCKLKEGSIELIMKGVTHGTPVSYQILEAPLGSESLIGYTGTTWQGWKNDYTLVLNGQTYFPKGRYKIKFIDAGCHNGREMIVNAAGNEATVTSVIKTPNCGSFNFKIEGTYGTGFEQLIVSGPAGTAGLVKASTETFTDMPYGTYKVALRIRNMSCTIFEETFTYNAESSIDFDALNSGGFTCTAGGKGDLYISASTTIPSATLAYSIDNGLTWQTSAIFANMDEGTYQVIIRDNVCGTQRTVTAAVISNINATINNQVNETTVCAGSPVVLNINAIGGTKYTWTYPDGTVHVGKIQSFANATTAMAGKYSVVVETGSCTTTPYEVVLKVTTKAIVTAVVAQTACVGISKTIGITGTAAKEFNSATSSIDLPVSYTWTNNNTAIGLPSAGTGSITFTPVNTGTTQLIANITVKPVGAIGCDGNEINFTITVNANSTIALTGGDAQTSCVGIAIAPIVFNLSNATAASVTTGTLPAGLTGTFNLAAQTYTISGTPTAAATLATYTVTATGECAAATQDFTLTVKPNTTVTLANGNGQTPCINTAITPIVFNLTNATGATLTTGTLPAGLTGVFDLAAQTYTISGTPTVATTLATYTVSATGDCAPVSGTFTLTVNALATTPTITVTAATCSAAGTATVNNYVAANTYTFSPVGPSVVAGGVISGMVAGTNYTVNTNNGSCTSLASANFSIAGMLPAATVPTISVMAASCSAPGTAAISNYIATNTYTFSPVGPSVGASGEITGITVGVSYTVTANNGSCNAVASASFSIDEMLPAAVAPIVTTTAATCTVAGTAKISNYVANITYTFSPSGPSVDAGGLINGLISGTNYTVTVNNGNCTSAASSSFSVAAILPSPVATISYNPSEYQTTGTAKVIQTGQAGGSYSASPQGLSINSVTGEIDLTASTPNQTYTVTYSFSNGSCTGMATTTVKVITRTVSITYAHKAYCAVGTAKVVLTGSGTGTYGASPQGLSINANTGEVNLATSKAGVYTITYTYQDGTITSSTTTNLTVNALPVVAITTDIPIGNSVALGDVATITATGGVSYSWTGDDIQSGQNTNVIKVRPKQSNTYTVTVTNESGCTETMQITINTVGGISMGKIVPNNVITPNGDGKNDTWVVKNLDFFPKHTVTIYDRAGRRLYTAKNYKNDWDGSYNGQPLAEGAYVYVIDSGEGAGVLKGTINIIRDKR